MIRRYCDICGREAVSVTSPRLASEMNRGSIGGGIQLMAAKPVVRFEIMCGAGPAMNGGDVCKYCVLDAINTLDDRPQQATP